MIPFVLWLFPGFLARRRSRVGVPEVGIMPPSKPVGSSGIYFPHLAALLASTSFVLYFGVVLSSFRGCGVVGLHHSYIVSIFPTNYTKNFVEP